MGAGRPDRDYCGRLCRGVDDLGAGRPAPARPGRRHCLDVAVVGLDDRVAKPGGAPVPSIKVPARMVFIAQPFTEPAVKPAT